MNQETMEAAVAAVRLYAETHPRPLHVTQKQAAAMLSFSQPTITKMVRAGMIKLNKLGQISISEIDRVLTSA
jgi:Mn-dependent DtxR family transcriptional regulator